MVEGRQHVLPVRVEPCETPPLLRPVGRVSLAGQPADEARRLLLEGMRAAAAGRAEPSEPPDFPGEGGQPDLGPPGETGTRPRYPGPDRQTLASMLLHRVERACRLRYLDAIVCRMAAGTQVLPYLDVEGQRDGERQRWPVGVSLDTPNEAAVISFYDGVVCPVFTALGDVVASDRRRPPGRPGPTWPGPGRPGPTVRQPGRRQSQRHPPLHPLLSWPGGVCDVRTQATKDLTKSGITLRSIGELRRTHRFGWGRSRTGQPNPQS